MATSIQGVTLNKLLRASPNLERLYLSHCKQLHEGNLKPLPAGCLSKLRLINLLDSSITAVQLNDLLPAASNLNSLFLRGCKKLGHDPLSLQPGCLPKLEDLNLSNTSIATPQLENLLLAAPNLTKLDLDDSRLSSDAFSSLKPGCLMKLKRIYLQRASITQEQLNQLKRAAPNAEIKYSKPDLGTSKDTSPFSDWGNISHSEPTLTDPHFDPKEHLMHSGSDWENMSHPEPTLTDPHFDPKEHLTHAPKKPNDGQDPSALSANNQGMIIAKLSHYLMTQDPQKHEDLVSSLQNGMCYPLALYFTQDPKNFRAFFEEIKTWEPKTSPHPSKALQTHFDTLVGDFLPFQTNQAKALYLGAEGIKRISKIKNPMVLSNPWHTIALEPPVDAKGSWTIYDPNYVSGPKTVSEEALESMITQALGNANLQIDLGSMPSEPVAIPKNFLKEGGLLTLCMVENWQDILSQFEKQTWSSEDLEDGLFLCGTGGAPAWLQALNSVIPEIQNRTKALLDSYKRECLNGDEALFKQKLRESIEGLARKPKKDSSASEGTRDPSPMSSNTIQSLLELMDKTTDGSSVDVPQASKEPPTPDTVLVDVPPAPKVASPLIDTLSTLIQTQKKDIAFKVWCAQYLKSQAVLKKDIQDLKHYAQDILSLEGNTLISCKSDEDRRTLQLELYHQGMHSAHPVYFIDSPEELLCSANYIDTAGSLHKGPGGPLYDFLKANKDNNPTLLINYDGFKDSDFVRYNALLDTEPCIDGVFFHQLFKDTSPNALEQGKTQLRVIGFRNTSHPNCYDESDFTSRMPNKRKAPPGLSAAPSLHTPLDAILR